MYLKNVKEVVTFSTKRLHYRHDYCVDDYVFDNVAATCKLEGDGDDDDDPDYDYAPAV
ncbi:hypothetical protein TIFTF001_013907 [Ficus carica]|uniref:Uncharacterized protein n=1 Tax=Ficus carica TaxID=3494 RepID=A0AA88A2V5_FICCA|nr:hypothetical protein TIFTF001_013907 [Ficus carica]